MGIPKYIWRGAKAKPRHMKFGHAPCPQKKKTILFNLHYSKGKSCAGVYA